MKKNKIIIFVVFLLVVTTVSAQTTKKEIFSEIYRTGSNYFAYPGPRQQKLTPPPGGYEPFYIYHYARHGSRYMSNNKYYENAINMLDSAKRVGLLSEKGEEVLEKLRIGYADAWYRDGDLTALGAVDAKSSTSRRCMLSMFNFCMEMQSLNPSLDIAMDASKHDMNFVVENLGLKPESTPENDALWKHASEMFEQAHDSRRLMSVLLTDPAKVAPTFSGRELMETLYNVAEDLQNVPELGISLIDIFTKDELFDMWQGYNASWLIDTGIVPGSAPYYHILDEVVDSMVAITDKIIHEDTPTMVLRFSHDSSVLPLAYILGLKETSGATADLRNLYKRTSIDKIIPMAANIQMVFYRKQGNSDILVKFLLNENETTLPALKSKIAPYYLWSDVRQYLKKPRQ